jgi:hypothetical protein
VQDAKTADVTDGHRSIIIAEWKPHLDQVLAALDRHLEEGNK